MALDTWLAFFLASWIISLSPGAGAIASMSSGLQYGFVRGYWNAIGLQLGLAMQIAVVAGGLGAVLAASSTAFYAIKWFGVAYLVYLAIKQWRALPMDLSDEVCSVRPWRDASWQGNPQRPRTTRQTCGSRAFAAWACAAGATLSTPARCSRP